MTLSEIKKLSDRELDARLAEKVLGWKKPRPGFIVNIPYYSKSLDAIAPLEAKTREKVGLWHYCGALGTVADCLRWEAVTASARFRAEAVLLCWEAE